MWIVNTNSFVVYHAWTIFQNKEKNHWVSKIRVKISKFKLKVNSGAVNRGLNLSFIKSAKILIAKCSSLAQESQPGQQEVLQNSEW